jgi:site-specific recombinase XerD
MNKNEFPEHVQHLLEEFQETYLITMKRRKPATVYAYLSDAKLYIEFLREKDPDLANLTINEDLYIRFLTHLYQRGNLTHRRKKKLEDNTVSRRLSGITAFWKFLYRKKMAPVAISRELMDIEVRYERNPTLPVAKVEYQSLLMEAFHVLNQTL